MKIIINSSSMVPIYEQIVDQVKAQIISGELKEDDNLPSVRTLSKELRISALTVKNESTYILLCYFITIIVPYINSNCQQHRFHRILLTFRYLLLKVRFPPEMRFEILFLPTDRRSTAGMEVP